MSLVFEMKLSHVWQLLWWWALSSDWLRCWAGEGGEGLVALVKGVEGHAAPVGGLMVR